MKRLSMRLVMFLFGVLVGYVLSSGDKVYIVQEQPQIQPSVIEQVIDGLRDGLENDQ